MAQYPTFGERTKSDKSETQTQNGGQSYFLQEIDVISISTRVDDSRGLLKISNYNSIDV